MELIFSLHTAQGEETLRTHIGNLVVAGWAGRDMAAIEHHIEELAALGVPRPSAVPLYYRVAASQLTQADAVQVVGPHTSGEAEAFIFAHRGELFVSLASDHTDRKLEAASVALSKQACPKPVARQAWRWADVQGHWDSLVLRASIVEHGREVPYQEGALASLRSAAELMAGYMAAHAQAGAGDASTLPDGTGMSCGTVPAIGGIRPAARFCMELHDPVLKRSIAHQYSVQALPEVA